MCKVEDGNLVYVGVLMLGVILIVVIVLGQEVKVGDVLVFIEVMKMEIVFYVD